MTVVVNGCYAKENRTGLGKKSLWERQTFKVCVGSITVDVSTDVIRSQNPTGATKRKHSCILVLSYVLNTIVPDITLGRHGTDLLWLQG